MAFRDWMEAIKGHRQKQLGSSNDPFRSRGRPEGASEASSGEPLNPFLTRVRSSPKNSRAWNNGFAQPRGPIVYRPKEPVYRLVDQAKSVPETTKSRGIVKPEKKTRREEQKVESEVPGLVSKFNVKHERIPPVIDKNDPVSPSMKENFRNILSLHPDGILVADFFNEYENIYNVPILYYKMGFITKTDFVQNYEDIFKMEKVEDTHYCFLYDAQLYPKAPRVLSTLPTLLIDRTTEIVEEIGGKTGITEEELRKEYLKRYGEKLSLRIFGFRNIAFFLAKCPKLFFNFSNGVCIIKSKKLREFLGGFELSKEERNWFIKSFFKKDHLDLNFTYKLPSLNEKSKRAIIVDNMFVEADECIYSEPKDLFFIQIKEIFSDFDRLMMEIDRFYAENERDYVLNKRAIVPDLAVAAQFSGNMLWHRGLVRSEFESEDKVLILYVDYGSFELIKKENIRALDKRFGELPVCALPSTLSSISYCPDPSTIGKVFIILKELIGKKIFINITHVGDFCYLYNSKYPLLHLVVVEPNSMECLNEKMIRENLTTLHDEAEIKMKKEEILVKIWDDQSNIDEEPVCYK